MLNVRLIKTFVIIILSGIMTMHLAFAFPGPIILDIGHQQTARGAQSPDYKINEFDFWMKYAAYVRNEIEAAGYPCLITNRSTPPKKQATKDVVFLNKPDKNGKRYPSTHHPEHIGAGMISADNAIDLRARCVIFLHLNCTTGKWTSRPPAGLIIYNKTQGKMLAEHVCEAMRRTLLDIHGEIPNANRGIKAIPRFTGIQPSAGWMNTLDEEKIPAIVFEAPYLDYKGHVDYLRNETKAIKLAETLGKGIVNWLNSTPRP